MTTPSPERVLERLDWTIVRRLDGLLQGDSHTLFHGFGLDLAELREYQVGDDVRAIDWNVTARMPNPWVRLFHEDREFTAWFLVDMSPSVDFGTTARLKRTLAVDVVAALARLLTRHGNRVGAILYGDGVRRVIPPRGGKPQVLRLIRDLEREPRLERAPMTDLGVLLRAAERMIPRRSLAFIVSDFISAPGWGAALGTLARRHEVLAIRLCDPREAELPDIGLVVVEDSETGEQLVLDTHDRRFRARFAEAARRRERELGTVFVRTGIDVLRLSTEGDIVKELVRFAALRRSRAAAAGRSGGGTVAAGRAS
jgi:uncharacterized protein (DUF58 family)